MASTSNVPFDDSDKDYMSVLSDSESFASCSPVYFRTERGFYPYIFEKTRLRIPGRCYFIGTNGPCQSGKSLNSYMQISAIFDDKKKNPEKLDKRTEDSVLVIYITQSLSTPLVNNTLTGLRRLEEVTKYVDETNIVRLDNITKIDANKNAIIVSMHSAPNEEKIIDYYQKTSKKWSDVFVLIDEVDQGGVKGTTDRMVFVKRIYDIAMRKNVAMRCAIITATLANLTTTMSMQTAKFISQNGEEKKLNQVAFDSYYVSPDPNYVGLGYILEKKSWFDFDFPMIQYDDNEKEVKSDIFYEKINSVDEKNKKYALISDSIYIKDHTISARRLMDCGFNASLVLNSEDKQGNYNGYYKNEDGEIKTWQLKKKEIEKRAKRGDMKYMSYQGAYNVNQGDFRIEKVKTEINSENDIILIEYIQSLYLRDVPQNHPKLHKFRMIRRVMELPDDFPESGNLKCAIVGGKMFDRGGNFQEPTTNLAPGLMAMDEDTLSQRGALVSQRIGRMFGNTKECYETMEINPILLCTLKILREVCGNVSLVEKYTKILKERNVRMVYSKNVLSDTFWEKIKNKAIEKDVRSLLEERKEEARRMAEEREEVQEETSDEEEDDIEKKVREAYMNTRTKVKLIIDCLIDSELPVHINYVRNSINYSNTLDAFRNYLKNGSSGGKFGITLWKVSNDHIILENYVKNIIINL
jgi:hypothetical protein